MFQNQPQPKLSKLQPNSPKIQQNDPNIPTSSLEIYFDPVNPEVAAGDSAVYEGGPPPHDYIATNEKTVSERDNIKLLHEKLRNLENRYAILYYENEKANIDLGHERHKVLQLERKLKFIQTNQPVLQKLKNAYTETKFFDKDKDTTITAPPGTLVEIRDKSIQTWDGIMCRFCKDMEKIRAQAERAKAFYDREDLVVLTKQQWTNIHKTVQMLKKCVGMCTKEFDLSQIPPYRTSMKEDIFEEILKDDFALAEKRIKTNSSISGSYCSLDLA